jgi:hypothetical protein
MVEASNVGGYFFRVIVGIILQIVEGTLFSWLFPRWIMAGTLLGLRGRMLLIPLGWSWLGGE